jgi:type IV pilus assembly protein PilW
MNHSRDLKLPAMGLPRMTLGFSLVELLIVMLLGMLLMAGIINVFVSNQQTYKMQAAMTRIQENGRYGIDLVIADLRRSGYWGGNINIGTIYGTEGVAAASVSCNANDNSWGRMVGQRVFGIDDSNANYACIADSDYLRGDVLAVRYASPELAATLESDRVYLRSSFFEGRIFKGKDQANNAILDPLQTIRDLVSHAFYVGPSDQQCPSGTTIPALFWKTLDTNGKPQSVQQIIGGEHLQVQYGMDSNGDGSTDIYLDAGAVTTWANVTSVRFWLLIRSECPDYSFNNTTSYVMGNQVYQPNDNYLRRLYTATVTLRN